MKLPNFGYHFARLAGRWRRKTYQALLPLIAQCAAPSASSIALEVYAYSGEAMLPEQVRSIRSFLRHVGRPTSFTVVSDGTYSERSIALLHKIDPAVSVRPGGEHLPVDLPKRFRHYVTTHPTGKQLGLFLSLPRNGPAFYVDSDVLFFADAADLIEDCRAQEASAFYLKDCLDCSVDPRLLREPNELTRSVNCGVLILFRPLDWSLGIRRYLELEGAPNFFTNQTIVQLVMHANGAQPLDEHKYVLELDDQFVYPDRHADPGLVLRHYVNPVRHKFWTTFS